MATSELTPDQARELWARHEEQGTPWWILAKQGATTEGALRRRVLDLLGVTGDSVEREGARGCQCDGPSRWCAVGGPLWRAMQEGCLWVRLNKSLKESGHDAGNTGTGDGATDADNPR